MHTFWKTINILLLTGILLVGVLLVGTMVPIPGNFKVKIVKSGSMEPAIMTGGIVVIKPEAVYKVGDVVTFGADTKTQIPTTHRIIEMGDSPLGASIRTKGDANNAPDARPTPLSEVRGKVLFTIPYVGFLLDFARKPIGFALLVGLPALAVIVDEVSKILAEVKRLRKKKHDDDSSSGEDKRVGKDDRPLSVHAQVVETKKQPPRGLASFAPREIAFAVAAETAAPVVRSKKANMLPFQVLFALLLPVITLGALASVGSTISYFSDAELSIGNYLKADPLGFAVVLPGSSSIDMQSGSAYLLPEFTPSAESEPIQYSLTSYMTGGDTTLCGLINVEATSTFNYSGSLLLLATGMTTTMGVLPLYFTLPDGYAANENTSCFVDLIFTGKNASAGPGQGYSFTEHLPVQFFVPASVPQDAFSPPAEILSAPVVIEGGEASDTPEQAFVPPSEPAPESDAASSSEEVLPPTIPTDDISPTSSEVVLPEEIPPSEVAPLLETTDINQIVTPTT